MVAMFNPCRPCCRSRRCGGCSACPDAELGDVEDDCSIPLRVCQTGCGFPSQSLSLRSADGVTWSTSYLVAPSSAFPGGPHVPVSFAMTCEDGRLKLVVRADYPSPNAARLEAVAYAEPGVGDNACSPACLRFQDFAPSSSGDATGVFNLVNYYCGTAWFDSAGSAGYESNWIVVVGDGCGCCATYCRDCCIGGDLCLSVVNGGGILVNCLNGPPVNLSLADGDWNFACSGSFDPNYCVGNPTGYTGWYVFGFDCNALAFGFTSGWSSCNGGGGVSGSAATQNVTVECDGNGNFVRARVGPGGWQGWFGNFCGFTHNPPSCDCSGTYTHDSGLTLPACVAGFSQDLEFEIVPGPCSN